MIAVILITLRQQYKTFLAVLLATWAMVFVSMSFYPEIVTSLGQLTLFFNSGALKQIFSVFNLNVSQLSDPIGFYETYCTMWVTLLGSVYFSYLGAQMIAKDIVSGEYKFVMMHPLSRYRIVFSRLILCFGLWFVYAITIGILGYASLATYTKDLPLTFDAEVIDRPLIEAMIQKSDAITPLLALSELEFQQFTNRLLQQSLSDQAYLAYTDQFDMEKILSVVGDRLENPDELFEMILEDPESYYTAFGIEGIALHAFIEGIEEEKASFNQMKALFLSGDALAALIVYDPDFFFEKIQERQVIDTVDGLLDGQLKRAHVYVPFIKRFFYRIHLKMVGIVGLNALLAFTIALGVKKKESAVALALGTVILMYFLNSLFALNQSLSAFDVLSTFSYFRDTTTPKSLIKYSFVFMVFIMGFFVCLKRFNTQDL